MHDTTVYLHEHKQQLCFFYIFACCMKKAILSCDCDGNLLDCAGVCFGGSVEDECQVCNGDGSQCNSPTNVEDLLYSIDEDEILDITLTGSDPNQIPLVFIIIEEPLNGEISGESPNLIYTPKITNQLDIIHIYLR